MQSTSARVWKQVLKYTCVTVIIYLMCVRYASSSQSNNFSQSFLCFPSLQPHYFQGTCTGEVRHQHGGESGWRGRLEDELGVAFQGVSGWSGKSARKDLWCRQQNLLQASWISRSISSHTFLLVALVQSMFSLSGFGTAWGGCPSYRWWRRCDDPAATAEAHILFQVARTMNDCKVASAFAGWFELFM